MFSKQLIHWYLKHKRTLPWRKSKDPYKVWLSEIILQQTRVSQGMAYYDAFTTHFPTVFELAAASEQEVLKHWQGLGYYSRARNLHFSARHIAGQRQGIFPETYQELLTLKGVGVYTAAAIASICYGENVAVVDGNVYRVLARYFGIGTAINSSAGVKEFKALAQSLIDPEIPGTFNQALMEFGALVCKPQRPNCGDCFLQDSCVALADNLIASLPRKDKKTRVRDRFFNYLVVTTPNNKTRIEKRTQGIWKNLYQFPLIEGTELLSYEQLIEDELFSTIFGAQSLSIKLFNQVPIVHKLTHQHIHTQFWLVAAEDSKSFTTSWNTLDQFPVSRLIDNFLNLHKTNQKITTFD